MNKTVFLPPSFYQRPTDVVARELLGKLLIRKVNGNLIKVKIVETEAYFGQGDPASHACRGKTKRNAVMFGAPGRAYVYFNYGMHYLLNVVTEPEGKAGAVLIRAAEPVAGLPKVVNLTNGPAKLTKTLGIDLTFNGKSLNSLTLGIVDSGNYQNYKIAVTPRIGISEGQELLLRFYLATNPFVSKTKPLKEEVYEVKRNL